VGNEGWLTESIEANQDRLRAIAHRMLGPTRGQRRRAVSWPVEHEDGSRRTPPRVDLPRQREVVAAFLAASQQGDFDALLALLDPDVIFRADAAARRMTGVPDDRRGAHAVATGFVGRAQGARLAFIDGVAGWMWAPSGKPRGVFLFRVGDGRIVQISLVANAHHVEELDIVAMDA
jgi:RNA polymerase sigma-70 factor, ECF subfamily